MSTHIKTLISYTAMLKHIIILLLINAQIASAVQISQILYNPIEESGSEAIELYNSEDQEINISGYYIKTESYEKDATIPEGIILEAGEYYLISDKGWGDKRDNKEWRTADYEESITIKNENSGIILYNKNNDVMDVVGWGEKANESLYKGEPAQQAKQGNSLLRIKNTGNNKEDFREIEPYFPPKNSARIIILQEVINIKFLLDKKEIQQNTKITPIAGKNQEIKIRTNKTIQAEFLEEIFTIEKEGIIELPYYLAPGNYSITIHDNEAQQKFSFEYLELKAYKADTTKILMDATIGKIKEKEITFTNQGNVLINLEFKLENLEDVALLDKENISIRPGSWDKIKLIVDIQNIAKEVIYGAIIINDN